MTLRAAMLCAAALAASCANVECSLNSDCGDRARCEMNRCVRDCVQDRDCPSGQTCNLNGACVGRPKPDDAPDDSPALEDGPATPDASLDAPFDAPFDASLDAPFDMGFDAPFDAGLDAPLDMGLDAPHDNGPPPDVTRPDVAPTDVAADAARPDASTGPVGVGVYEYTGVRPDALVAPVAAAWHPGGAYALVLSAYDGVFRFDAGTRAVTRVASTARDVSWRALAFTPDGARALLLANTASTSGGTTTRRGRLFVWDHAASTLSERTSEAWSMGAYESIRWSPDGRRAALLGSATSYLSIWWVDAMGARAAAPVAYSRAAMTACNDLAWVTDGFGDPALAVVCGTNTAEILSVTGLDGVARFTSAASAGAIGNTSRIAARPQGDLALAVGWSGQRLYRYRAGHWDTGFSTPQVIGAFGVAFSDDGMRALAFGGFGRAHEYRYDLYGAGEVVDVSIAGLAGAPYNQPTSAVLNDVAWRPGCDEGLAVGGASASAFVAYFRVTNGRACR